MLPRKFLNQDEELLAELRPHWIFLFGPLFTSLGTWAVLIVIVILWHSAPGWTNYPFLILALIPGLWLLGRYIRWRSYIIALTSTRILVRQGIFGRDTVQLRLQRIVEVNLRQALIERVLQCGSLLIDVQGEDDTLTLEYVRKPTIVQRVINSQINEIVGGGEREPIPQDMLPFDQRSRRRDRPEDTGEMDTHHTPPFGQSAVTSDYDDQDATDPGSTPLAAASAPAASVAEPRPAPPPPATPAAAAAPPDPGLAAGHFDVRDRLIQLDDLRKRGIISEEEFAAKKTELLDRI
jgi:membrane protein YdbS with pleckstrin-like domain